MNSEEIQKTIRELVNSETTFANCEKLASLVIVNDFLGNNFDSVVKEYKDILPSYSSYKTAKTDYQLHKTNNETVICTMKNLCREIFEFICQLYSTTDMQAEREEIVNTLDRILVQIRKR